MSEPHAARFAAKKNGDLRATNPSVTGCAGASSGHAGRKGVVFALAAILFLASASLASAQNSTQGGSASASPSGSQTASQPGSKEITIEELFLRSVEFQILREKAASDDYDIKMSALDDLEKKINAGVSGSDTAQVEFVLEYLAMEGSGRVVREAGRQVNNFPEVRRRAASLLGRVGTEESKNALIRTLLIDDEPMVKAEAAYALGNLGMNPGNQVVQAIEFAYNMEDPTAPDQNFGYAISLAIEKLAQKTPGGLKDPEAYRLLVKIAQGNYLRTVKAKALQVLDELKSSK
ncbi:MAG TPA: HEAT repeat domain-containing protein [Spirochaetia bacterium]|nr:HEAT repeat domain-containing protein [Spirochaetia bacterium]